MNSPTVMLPWEALNQIMAVYEGHVPPNPPVEYSKEPSDDEELPAAAKGSIATDDLTQVLAVVTPLWDVTPMSDWALDEAKEAVERGQSG